MYKVPPAGITDSLSYNPETGIFTWSQNAKPHLVGVVAGSRQPIGYIHIWFGGKFYYAHRLAFLFMKGEMPPVFVDHINGIRDDNRWVNLRACSKAENTQNRLLKKRRLLPGVTIQKGYYVAQICKGRKNHYLGRWDTEEEAHEAYLRAKAELHPFSPTIRVETSREAERIQSKVEG